MKRPSLRLLILGSVLATITVGFAVFGFYIDQVDRNNRLEDIDDELVRAERTALGRFPSSVERPGAPGGPAAPGPPDGASDEIDSEAAPGDVDEPVQILLSVEGEVVSSIGAAHPFDAETLERLATSEGAVTTTSDNYRARVTGVENGLVVTALPLTQYDSAAVDFRKALLAGGATILAILAALLWALTRFLTKPVTTMTETAAQIANGQLDTQVGEPGGSRETAQLATDLDRMLTRLRSSLSDSEQSAAEASRSRDDMQRFLADMSHELRTPLTALKGYSDLYAGGMLQETADVDRAMERIGSESERLYRLANEMLQLAREGSADQPRQRFDLAELAGEVVDDLRAAYPSHQIDLAAAPSTDVVVDGVREHLHQALLNLGSNAAQYSPSERPITVQLDVVDDQACVAVVDHGPGIAPADRERVFLPFFRAEDSRSRANGSGAGLGLALTKRIVDQHRGTVTVEETPGGGATFRLLLPTLV